MDDKTEAGWFLIAIVFPLVVISWICCMWWIVQGMSLWGVEPPGGESLLNTLAILLFLTLPIVGVAVLVAGIMNVVQGRGRRRRG